jgi:photosystem II stability/assembly factor-like uncharacterized protein
LISRSKTLLVVLALLWVLPAWSQDTTIFMSILASRRHRLNAADNPVVGLYVSTDRGVTWVHRGWREYIRIFYTEQGEDGTIWSACGNGVLRSTDNGATWRVTTGSDVTEVLKVHVSPADPRAVFAATAYGIIRSTDRGDHWKKVVRGFHRTFTSDLAIDRSNPKRILVAAEEGLYESTNGGDSWRRSSFPYAMVNVIVQHPSRHGEFWLGTEEHGLFYSTNAGKKWKEANRGLTHRTIYTLAFNPIDPEKMYVGTYGGGVFRSDDGGMNWTAKNEGLKKLDVHSLLVVPGAPEVVLCGTLNGGLYRSTDRGEHWVFNGQEDSQVWGLFCSIAPRSSR